MCTTMRRIRRATPEGTRRKMTLRKVTRSIHRLTRRLVQAEGMMSELVNLRSVERALR